MKIRLNKLISDYGICTRREADLFIEEGRVTVNGKRPDIGDSVTENDIILVDDAQISVRDLQGDGAVQHTSRKAANLVFGEKLRTLATRKKSRPSRTSPVAGSDSVSSGAPRRERYGKYNKYAAARKAARQSAGPDAPMARKPGEKPADHSLEDVIRKASVPETGKSMKMGAVSQRIAAASKSASLRKTSKNNPVNKARRNTRGGRKGN